jgi:hypothetical protein
MNRLYRVVAAGAFVAIGLCNFARGQRVLEQVPSKAAGVFEVKDLQAVSTKVAKFAKTLGIDQFDPRFADPLAALLDEYELKQGVNKTGDMAIAFFAPREGENLEKEGEKQAIVLVPTSDFKAFLGNFQDVTDDGGGVWQVTVPKNKEKLFVAEHGAYAAAAKDKALLAAPVGMKIEGAVEKEAQTKDALLFINMKVIRPKLEKGLKEARTELDKQIKAPNAGKANPIGMAMTPQLGKMLEGYLNAADQIVRDTRDAAFTLNISDTGISTSAVAAFEPDSDLGHLVAQVKNTDQPLNVGLPTATYFAFGGAVLTPEVTTRIFTDFLEPLVKDAPAANAADLTKAFDAMKEALGATKTVSLGYVAGGGKPGEGLVGVVGVSHGDANKILEAQKAALPAANAFMGMGGQKMTAQIDMGEPKTIEGVKFQPYTMKFNFDPNNAQAAQAQQAISIMYGRNGLNGLLGAVNDNTFLTVMGDNEKVLTDAIASAKADSDDLDNLPHVKKVAGELPRQRAAEFYVALDNIATSAIKMMKQQGFAIPFKLPPNLPPIGISIGTDGSTARFDMIIPTQLIQSMTAAGMQAFMQMNGGPGAGQGGGI